MKREMRFKISKWYIRDDRGEVFETRWDNGSGVIWGVLYEIVNGDGELKEADTSYGVTGRELEMYWREL